MATIEFKAKIVELDCGQKIIKIPNIKASHITDRQRTRQFSGKVSDAIVNVRARKIMKEMGIGIVGRYGTDYTHIDVNNTQDCVSISGNFMATVSITLPEGI